MKTFRQKALVVLVAILGGGLTFWATRGDEAREFKYLAQKALCVLELQPGMREASASFTTSRTIDQFQVGLRSKGKHGLLSIAISGSKGLICSLTTDLKNNRFGCGKDIPPGTYHVKLSREAGSEGASVVIAGEKPVFLTGWQMLSRGYVGLLLLSGIWAALTRKSQDLKQRALGSYMFQMLLLGFMAMFFYLLFHEGGHSLAELIFGRYDLAASDFWGIHGSPHSGGILRGTSAPLKPWQQALISGGGPLLPTFAGWALFLLWSSRFGRHLRNARPMVNFYYSALVAMLVFPGFIVMPGFLLGIMSDGDWRGLINNVPGPYWLVRGLLWATVPVSAWILWRVVPELRRAWKALFLDLWKSVSDPPLNPSPRPTPSGSDLP